MPHLLTRDRQPQPDRRESRREWFERIASIGLAAPTFCQSLMLAQSTSSRSTANKLTIPGPYRGRVISVAHPGSIIAGRYQREACEKMIRKGMMELTGAPDHIAAWRTFVQPGEVIGIKLNPVGRPNVISSPEMVQVIISHLEAAGIKRRDIVAYDRYKQEFYEAGFDKWLPEGVRIAHATAQYDQTQQRMDGYDPDHWMDMQLTLPGFDYSNERARRSYAAQFITKTVDKMINLPILKHHQSAGVTMALKNMSHGLVNNVNRSHSSPVLNACGAFIPAVVSIPVIRDKCVLHILDAVQSLAHGGPGGNDRRKPYIWEHKTLYFATDPVAMDKVGLDVIDAKRKALGMESIADAKPDPLSRFVRMQPEHIEIAGALGLGEADPKKIDLRAFKLA
jgi:hypothetical protein